MPRHAGPLRRLSRPRRTRRSCPSRLTGVGRGAATAADLATLVRLAPAGACIPRSALQPDWRAPPGCSSAASARAPRARQRRAHDPADQSSRGPARDRLAAHGSGSISTGSPRSTPRSCTRRGATSHMHVGAVMLFEGPPPAYEDCLDTLRGAPAPRAALPPEARRSRRWRPAGRCGSTTRASTSSTTCATPRCRSPGSEEQLLLLAARIFSQQLDRSKPLWETWLVEGLADGGFALISKTHHALIDGIAGVDLAPGALRPRPGPDRGPAPRRAVAARARAEPARSCWPSGIVGPGAHRPAHGARPPRRSATRPAEALALGARGRRGPRRGRVGGPEPGARRRR